MEKNLPLVAMVGSDPAVTALLGMMLGDICRVDHFPDSTALIESAEFDPPAIILLDLDLLKFNPRGMNERIKAACPTAAIPLVYVSAADTGTSDDGSPLADCFATMARPAEFRATIEARLRRHRGPHGT